MELLSAELLPLAGLLLATGLLAGGVAGLLGVGGGIVIVPVLFHVFAQWGIDPSVRMHLAVGTSLATIVVTAWRSARSHHVRGAVDVPLLRGFAVPVLAGVGVGSALARFATGAALTAVFAAVALAVALHMAFGRENWRLLAAPPTGAPRAGLGFGIGLLSVLMGLGGGTLGVPLLSVCGVPIHRAVGTAAGLGLLIAIPGALAFAASGWGAAGLPPGSIGYVYGPGFALIAVATAIAAPWGARFAHAVPQRTLRRAFALFLALTAARMFGELG